ncbi:hypothetical protein [Streptomyces griseorubiginosus]|uniref:hypothetical protein n=1 Tax=Streptomyces griseorubiginosus TaxID=67304 RepID=UPI0033F077F6
MAVPRSFAGLVGLQGEMEWFLNQDVPGAAAEALAARFEGDLRAEEGSFAYVRLVL